VNRVLLLAGKPGTGKTALIREAISRTRITAGGFYTEEIRTGGVRQGFRIVTLDGQQAILAHVNISSPYQVSKYKVDINSLDEVGVPAIHQALKEYDVTIIDEIGKMELLSLQFKQVVRQAIDSDKKVLGTIMLGPHPFADEVKSHPQVELLLVSRDNHNQALREILRWLEMATK